VIQLDVGDVRPYLVGRGVLDASDRVAVEALPGGYVNRVFLVTLESGSFVVKQGLAESERTLLRADVRRALMEAAALKAIGEFLGDGCPIPTLLHHDPESFVIVMTAAPRHAVLYEQELLAGRFHPGIPSSIGSYAGRLHDVTRGNVEIRRQFTANPGFALRDQSIRSAIARNPDLAGRISALLQRNREEATTLVDADITPKNVLVHDGEITKLDFECTQWGDPALDVGIVLAHFVLIAFARPEWRKALMAEADLFLEAYARTSTGVRSAWFMRRSSEYAAAMMLGRVDGDLVIDYLRPHGDGIRSLARRLLAEPPGSWTELATIAGSAFGASAGTPAGGKGV
jgi:5-methylthioribose kinase